MKNPAPRLASILSSALILAAASTTFAVDPTITSTQRLISQVFTPSRETALVVAALRTTKDPAVIKIFDQLMTNDSPDLRIYAMVSAALITHDPNHLDIANLLKIEDPQLVGSALASLIDEQIISDAQLNQIATTSHEPALQVMAASELSRRGVLKDRTFLRQFLEATSANKDVVRYYASVTLLQAKQTDDYAAALSTLHDLSALHDARAVPIAGLMIIRVRKEKITAALPWVLSIAQDTQQEMPLRLAAVATLLSLKHPQGPGELAQMIEDETQQDSPSIVNQIKYGLVALEFADQLQPAQISQLSKTHSTLVRSVAALARDAVEGKDATPGLISLMKEGDPIILTWALAYADRAPQPRKNEIYLTLVNLSTIVDDQRERDFENAASAAEKIADDPSADNRRLLMDLLRSENRAVVEATLAGMLRSDGTNFSDLVLPIWPGLNRSAANESAANYAALILGREGHKEPLAWLSGMVQGGTVQNPGFRVLAGWYYAKLTGNTEELLNQVLASAK